MYDAMKLNFSLKVVASSTFQFFFSNRNAGRAPKTAAT